MGQETTLDQEEMVASRSKWARTHLEKKCTGSLTTRRGRSVSLREERKGQLVTKKRDSAQNVLCVLGTLDAVNACIYH